MEKQMANRLGVAHVRDTMMQFVTGAITREQAMESLRIEKTRLYDLRTSYLAARAEGKGDEWTPGVSGGNHMPEWPDNVQRFLKKVLGPNGDAKRYSYAFAASEVGRQFDMFIDRSQVRHWAIEHGLGVVDHRVRPVAHVRRWQRKSKFSDAMWVKCYRDELFTGYSRRRMIENIRSPEEMMKFLIDVRKINTEDVGVALSRIKDADALERIKNDCYLKIVAERADLLHFTMTYPRQLESIGKMSIKVDRALAANEFRKRMEDADIEEGRKRKISAVLDKWIDIGVDQILAESENLSDVTLPIAGFRIGMKEKEAILLLKRRYCGEDVSWSVDADGLVERINFGTTFLAKIYKFDAQTWAEWVDSFSRKTGKRFVGDELKAEKKPVGGRGVVVGVSQRIWRCQDNSTDLTITYFGDKRVQEITPEGSGFLEGALKMMRGVTGGDIMKEAVLESYGEFD